MRGYTAACAFGALFAAAAPAEGQAPAGQTPPSQAPQIPQLTYMAVQLKYVVEPGAEMCPTEERLHNEVMRRIGYDPFVPNPSGKQGGVLTVRLGPVPKGKGKGLVARYQIVTPTGADAWPKERTYTVPSHACPDVIEGVAVDLAVEWDDPPLPPASAAAPPAPVVPAAVPAASAPSPPLPAGPAPALRTTPPVAPVVAPQTAVEARHRLRVELGVGLLVTAGIEPGVTVGGIVHIGLHLSPFAARLPTFSIAIEGRADQPGTSVVRAFAIESGLLAAGVTACVHNDLPQVAATTLSWGLHGCVLGLGGVVRSTAPWYGAAYHPYVGVGVRGGVEARIREAGALRLSGDLVPSVNARAASGYVEKLEVWRSAAVAGNASLSALVFF